MAKVELIMPKMGESIMEATILKWNKAVGDVVEEDESVLEIATDKVDSEVPSPTGGTIAELLYKEGDTVEVGKPIAIITTVGAEGSDAPVIPEQPAASPEPAPVVAEAAPTAAEPATMVAAAPVATPTRSNGRFYSPLVLNIAKSENISMSELEQMPGTGKEGRVTKKDILAYIKNRTQETPAASPITAQPSVQQTTAPAIQSNGNVEIVEMDRMRKLIAEHMVRSKHTSPHVTSFVEADVTNLVLWRNRIKHEFEKREGTKITFTPLFIEAVVKAIKDFPMINSSLDGDRIIIKKDINIGMAAALPSGNLIVPVIKHADQLNLTGLAHQVNDLASRARSNQLKPDEIDGGTFTLTNVGTFGNAMGTPIINQPQVAILATGSIKKKPVVLETPQGDTIAIRHMMFLSHSYDHRVIDGALGGSFVRKVADYLEQFDMDRSV